MDYKRENDWYVRGKIAQSFSARQKQTWGLTFILVAVVVGYTVVTHGSSPEEPLSPFVVFAIVTAFVSASLLYRTIRIRRAHSAWLQALQSTTPETAIAATEQALAKAAGQPDVDAVLAQSRAVAYALYGQSESAVRALLGIDWTARAPIVQAMGLRAEGMIDLLCGLDASRSLEKTRRARTMAALSKSNPIQQRYFLDTCIGVGEAIQGTHSPSTLQMLEKSASNVRVPLCQLLASFGLAIVAERSGNSTRAEELRAFIRRAAPHCAPLQMRLEQFLPHGERSTSPTGEPVSATLASLPVGDYRTQERLGKRVVYKRIAKIIVPLVLAIGFILFHNWLSQAR